MQNKKVIIAIILCIGAVISLIYGLTARPKRRKASLETVSARGASTPVRRIIPTKRRTAKTDFVTWGRNPFVPKETPAKALAKLTLNGIIWDEENPKALINNVVLGIGDKIERNTVIDITQDSVILNDGTGDVILNLAY